MMNKLNQIIKKIKLKYVLLGISTIILTFIFGYFFLRPSLNASAWFNNSWIYRVSITIGNTGSADSNKKVKLDIDTSTLISANKLQANCEDSRFTDATGKLLKYYIDSAGGACNTASTDYYVLMESIPNGSSIIYHYYGNSSATNGTEGSQFGQGTFAPTSGPTINTEEQTQSPIAAWSFDEGYGLTVQDSISDHDGALTSGPVWKPDSECIVGSCLFFDGSDDHVDVPDSPAFDIGNNGFTYSAWIKAIDYPQAYNMFMGHHLPYFNIRSAGTLHMSMNAAGAQRSVYGSTVLQKNQWYYVAATYDSSGYMRVYLNGKVDGIAGPYLTATNYNYDMFIGRWTSNTTYQFKGYIDEPRVYSYARSDEQIKQEYNARGTIQGASTQIGNPDLGKTLTQGLVGYWKMDEGTGTTSTDFTGNNITISQQGTVGWSSGKYGSSLVSDIGGLYATDNDLYDNTSEITISTWLYRDTSVSWQRILGKYYYSGAHNGSWLLWFNDTDSINFTLNNGSSYVSVTTAQTIPLDTWTHVTATYDGAQIKIYINGALSGTQATTGSIPNTSYCLTIGYSANTDCSTGAQNRLDGQVDEVRIYRRTLTGQEIRALYEYSAGPVGHWKLDENTGLTAQDSSGVGTTGTLTNGPTWTTGKFGNAVSFDGSNDSINAGSESSLEMGTKNWTMGGWFKTADTTNRMRMITRQATGYYFMGFGLSNTLYYGINDGTNTLIIESVSAAAFRNDMWHHYMISIDKSSNTGFKVYIDGVLVDTRDPTSVGNVVPSANTQIGIYSASTQPFIGSLDDIRIYNYARTQSQIIEDMNGSHPIGGSPVGSQIAYWKFDEGFGTRTNNTVSLSTNIGNLLGGTTPTWTNDGVFNKALFFQASTGSNPSRMSAAPINMGTATGSQITITMWMKPSSTQTNASAVFLRNGISTDANYYSYLTSLSGGKFQIATGWYNGSGFSGSTSSTRFIPAGTWSHLGIVITQGTDVKYYLNGKLTETDAWVGANAVQATTFFTLGGHTGTTGQSYDGYMDEVKIYGTGLTDEQIKTDYNRGKSLVLGSTSTGSDGTQPSNSASREYCVPGDTATCSAPVAEWKFDEGASTTTVNDTSGNSNTGSMNGSMTQSDWVSGKKGMALDFDGNNDYISVNHTTSLVATSSFTLSTWAYVRAFPGAFSFDDMLVKSDVGSENYWFEINDVSEINCGFISGGIYYDHLTTTANLSTNTWYHLVCVFDDTANRMRIYVNGQEVLSEAETHTPDSSGTGALNIGRATAGTQYFNGLLDDIKIFTYARTPSQIAWDYNRGAPVAWYKLDECQGVTAFNSARNGNNQTLGSNGTITIGASGSNTSAGTCVGSAGQAWADGATGKLGASLEFDGTDDNISITNSAFAVGTGDFSISTWIKIPSSIDSNSRFFSVGNAYTYELWVNGVNLVAHAGDTTASRSLTSNYALTPGEWYHVTAVYDRDTALYLYVNGKLERTQSGITSYSSTSYTSTSGEIGGYVPSNLYNFEGQIDDVRFYNYALNSSQIKQILNNGGVRFQ